MLHHRALARCGQLGPGQFQSIRRQPVRVPWRYAVLRRHPASFQQRVLFETHENGVERPGLHPSFTAQLVTVAPVGWTLHEPFQHQESLGRYAWYLHGLKSIYVDLVCQALFFTLGRFDISKLLAPPQHIRRVYTCCRPRCAGWKCRFPEWANSVQMSQVFRLWLCSP